MFSFDVETKERSQMIDITARVNEAVRESGIVSGLCLVYCPHTTAAITVNENADPDVQSDLLKALAKAAPDLPAFRHSEGNSDAHLKSSLVGCSELLIVEDGRLRLGRWQGVYFCEFDGPRRRSAQVKVIH